MAEDATASRDPLAAVFDGLAARVECRIAALRPVTIVDPVATALRICKGNALRNAKRVSAQEVATISQRMLALEDIAGTAFHLLADIDALCALDPVHTIDSRASRRDLKSRIVASAETLTEALAALGYSQESMQHD